MRPLPELQKQDDPFFAHFPKLKSLLLNTAHGRWHGALLKYASDPRLMQNWDTRMRYAPHHEVSDKDVGLWRQQAHEIMKAMEV